MPSTKRAKKQVKKPTQAEPTHDLKMTIEARAKLDHIELEHDEDDETQPEIPQYRLNFHVTIPEALAQQFFQRFVKDGLVAVEFHPNVDPEMLGDWLVRA